jgi:hypothetical protein
MKNRMSKELLDELIIELLNTSSSSGKENIKLQRKIQEFKDYNAAKIKKELDLKTEYNNKYGSFRNERIKVTAEYMEEYHQLKNNYQNATENRKIEALHKWLLYSTTIPEILQKEDSKIFTLNP